MSVRVQDASQRYKERCGVVGSLACFVMSQGDPTGQLLRFNLT